MKVASVLGGLAVLPAIAASSHSGLASQQTGDYATTSEKPNILFIFTDDQGE